MNLTIKRVATLSVALAAAVLLWGGSSACTTDEIVGPTRAEPEAGPLPANAGAADRTEIDLVQEMLMHRAMYARHLAVLAAYYAEHGYETRASWARTELKDLRKVRPYRYILEDTSGAEEPDKSVLFTSLENPAGVELPTISVEGRSEVDLVEDMILHRDTYKRLLRVLATTYYSERGLENKANWARSEMNDLEVVKPYRYLKEADAPRAAITPRESIAEADKLYEEGHALLRKGGHHVLFFYHDETMKRALAKFKELVERYPASDKVAEAAYYIAEIHKEYSQERDNEIAIEWYQRAVEWDPDLNHPAWSHAAHILDFRMHDRDRALEWYQKVLEREQDKRGPTFLGNVRFAEKRIEQLTKEETRLAPGEPIPAAQPPEHLSSPAARSAPPPRVP